MTKHSKYKNTGILFELLVRQVTNDTLQGMDNSPAVEVLREFFKKNTSLKKELGLYQTLQNQKFKSESKANAFIDAVLKEHRKLSKSVIKKQKYNLIKEIKSRYNLESFFSQRINNYTSNASIFMLMEGSTPSKLIKFRYNIVEAITGKKKSKLNESHSIYQEQDKDIRLLSYKILIEKFNEKWGDNLSLKQRNLLKEYINNISNTTKLKDYLFSEITKTSKVLNKLSTKIADPIVKIKLLEVSTQIKNIDLESNIKDKYIISLMRTYDLIKEVKNVIK
jgi:hypothetical protein|tara:strand:+ start:170 stop:1006 length:837 start_codon:yes stop_codon:yes gene_type:complete